MKRPFGKRALLAVVMVPLAIALLTTDARLHSEEKKADKNPAVKKSYVPSRVDACRLTTETW